MAAPKCRHRGRWLACLGGLVAAICTAPAAVAARTCTGDCGGDGAVTVDEVLVLVNIALGSALPITCPGIGATVEIDTIVAAVGDALAGCDAAPGLSAGTVTATAGGIAELVVSLDSAFPQPVFATLNTIALPPELTLVGSCRRGTDLEGAFATFGGADCPTTLCVRALVVGKEGEQPIPAGGPLYTCTVRVAADTALGPLSVVCTGDTTVAIEVAGVGIDAPGVCRGGAVIVSP